MFKIAFGNNPIQKMPARQAQMDNLAGEESSIGVVSAASLLQ